MDYLDALSATVTQQEVINEMLSQGMTDDDTEEFFEHYGIHEEYEGSEVLEFLGY